MFVFRTILKVPTQSLRRPLGSRTIEDGESTSLLLQGGYSDNATSAPSSTYTHAFSLSCALMAGTTVAIIDSRSFKDDGYVNLGSASVLKSKRQCNDNSIETSTDGLRGDIIIKGMFERNHDCIIDGRVTDMDAPS